MIDVALAAETLGFIAGTLGAVSGLPRLLELLGAPRAPEGHWRNAMLVSANALWVVVGILKASLALIIMCAIATIMNSAVLLLTLQAARRNPVQKRVVRPSVGMLENS